MLALRRSPFPGRLEWGDRGKGKFPSDLDNVHLPLWTDFWRRFCHHYMQGRTPLSWVTILLPGYSWPRSVHRHLLKAGSMGAVEMNAQVHTFNACAWSSKHGAWRTPCLLGEVGGGPTLPSTPPPSCHTGGISKIYTEWMDEEVSGAHNDKSLTRELSRFQKRQQDKNFQ